MLKNFSSLGQKEEKYSRGSCSQGHIDIVRPSVIEKPKKSVSQRSQ